MLTLHTNADLIFLCIKTDTKRIWKLHIAERCSDTASVTAAVEIIENFVIGSQRSKRERKRDFKNLTAIVFVRIVDQNLSVQLLPMDARTLQPKRQNSHIVKKVYTIHRSTHTLLC